MKYSACVIGGSYQYNTHLVVKCDRNHVTSVCDGRGRVIWQPDPTHLQSYYSHAMGFAQFMVDPSVGRVMDMIMELKHLTMYAVDAVKYKIFMSRAKLVRMLAEIAKYHNITLTHTPVCQRGDDGAVEFLELCTIQDKYVLLYRISPGIIPIPSSPPISISGNTITTPDNVFTVTYREHNSYNVVVDGTTNTYTIPLSIPMLEALLVMMNEEMSSK